ncbi:MAG TPA: choice-of-anchor D domain-containing protein [Edaphobacter sp.]|nr:choice-of-anchor D domain-containing protein [Edaphobacter sp.]
MNPGANSGSVFGRGAPFLCAHKAVYLAILLFAASTASLLAQQRQYASSAINNETPRLRAQNFLRGRGLSHPTTAAQSMSAARTQEAELLSGVAPVAHDAQSPSGLNAAWQPLGPAQVESLAYGKVTGRVTAIAVDPADASGNTVYLGTTGGGVWKSTNAAGPQSDVTFAPLTDTLPVYNQNSGSYVMPSLSIGAVSVHSGIVLAGTGDPNDATDSFYGGGILRSDDAGLTWTLIQQSDDGVNGHHSFIGLGVAGFAWSSISPNTVVVAISQAAEGALVSAPDANNSVMGLYYSSDAGVTWQMATIMDGSQRVQRPLSFKQGGSNAVTAVVWNPVRQRFYAAVRYHGYYESADGATWTRLTSQPGINLDLTTCPTNPDGSGNPSCPIFRGALAVQPVTGDTFALTVDRNNVDQGLWQDVCALSGTSCSRPVTFGTQLTSTPLETGSGRRIPQADYDLALAAVPAVTSGAPDTLLFAGTVDLYRCSLANGCSLRNTTNAVNGCVAPAMVAPAQHAIAAVASSSTLYLGNDGGLWRSTDNVNQQATPCSADDATHFQNLNGSLGSLAEVVSFAQHPTDPGTLLAGLGANGTAATSSASPAASTAWQQLSPAEGGTVAIDQNNPLLWYISNGAGVNIKQCANGAACTALDFAGASTIGAAQTANDISLIDVPWLLDPALSSNVLIGTCRAWRGAAANGAGWSSANAISRFFGGSPSSSCSSNNPMVRSLAAAGPAGTRGSQVLYAGMAGALDGGVSTAFGGHLFSTAQADTAGSTTAWTDLALSPVTNDFSYNHKFNPGGFDISSIAADPHDPTGKTVYATVMGFRVPHLYRSTDGGANWTNISGNLPDAPANSIVVDPNNANTLYVALDTGVYVTTQASNCAGVSCWSIYGSGLPNAPVTQLAVASAMPTGDGRTGMLRAATYGRGIWQIPLLTAGSAANAAISLAPGALNFGSQTISTASEEQVITVTNSGDVLLNISGINLSGDFAETDTCTSASVPIGATCLIHMRFLPIAIGSRTGLLTIYANVSGGQITAALSGTGTDPAPVVINPAALSFPATTVNSTTAAQNITISNTSTTTITLQNPTVTGDFHLTANTCGATLASQTGCTVAIAFTPTANGVRTGTFSIGTGAGPQTAALSGTGTLPATDALSTSVLIFGPQQLTTVSVAQQVILTNSGDEPLTGIAARISTGDFTVANACGNSLNPHSSCAINVSFQPQNIGPASGTLIVSDQYRAQTVSLTGTGVAPPGVSLSPLFNLTFPATGVGQSALPQTVTLSNNGGVLLSISSFATSGDFSILPGSNTCGSALAPATACTLQIIFVPTASGARSGTLTVTDSAPNSPQTLRLSGTAVDFAIAADGDTTVTIPSGEKATFPLLFRSSSTGGAVAFTCTGAPVNSSCTITPSTASLNGSPLTVSVVVQTGIAASAGTAAQGKMLWLAMLLPLSLFALRRRRIPPLICLLLLVSVLFPLGCGAGRKIPTDSPPGGGPSSSGSATPAGTYPIVVSATSAGLTRTIQLTIIVK